MIKKLRKMVSFALIASMTLNNLPINTTASQSVAYVDNYEEAVVQSERRQNYNALLEGNYSSGDLLKAFEDLFGIGFTAEDIRNNYSEIFDISEDEVDFGIINTLAAGLEGLEPPSSDMNSSNFETMDMPVEDSPVLDEAPVPDIIYTEPLQSENVEFPDEGDTESFFDLSITDDEDVEDSSDTSLDLETSIESDNDSVVSDNLSETFVIETASYTLERLDSSSIPERSSRATSTSASNGSFTSISLVSKTDTSITINVTYKSDTDGNNILYLYNPVTSTWDYLLGRDGKPQASSGKYTVSNLKPGAVYTLRATTYDWASLSWKDSEIKVQTTPNDVICEAVDIATTSMSIKVSFPCNDVWGNRLQYYNPTTRTWDNISSYEDYYTKNGTYTISGLSPSTQYTIYYAYYDHMNGQFVTTYIYPTTAYLPEVLVSSETSNLIFSFEQIDIDRFEGSNYTTWKNRMEVVYNDMYELTGAKQYSGKIEIQSTRDKIPDAWGQSGNPIYINQEWVPDMINRINTMDDWAFGAIHEIGHDFDSYKWNFDSEFWTNLKMYYVIEKNNATVYAGYTDYYTGSQLKTFYKSESYWDKPGHANQAYDFTVAQGKYGHKGLVYNFILIQEQIGWEPFKQTFRYFNDLSYSDVPISNIGKLNLFLSKLCDYSGKDVFSMFTSAEKAVYESHFGGTMEYVQQSSTWYKMNVDSKYVYIKEPSDSDTTLEATVVNSAGTAIKYEYKYGYWSIGSGLAYVPGGSSISAASAASIVTFSSVDEVIIDIQSKVGQLLNDVVLNLDYEQSIMDDNDWSKVTLGITIGLLETAGTKSNPIFAGAAKSLLITLSGSSEASLQANYYYISAKAQTEFIVYIVATVAYANSFAAAGAALEVAGVTVTSAAVSFTSTGGLSAPVSLGLGVASIDALIISGALVFTGISYVAMASEANTLYKSDYSLANTAFLSQVHDALGKIAEKHKLYECKEAADEMADYLQKHKLKGTVYMLTVPTVNGYVMSFTYDNLTGSSGTCISKTGIHYGVEYDGIVHCNIHPYGIARDAWKADFYSSLTLLYGYESVMTAILTF